MSTATTLIRASEVVNQGILKGAPIGQRFDASLLAPNIYIAEIKHLKDIINDVFFDDLLSKRNTNDCNYNPPNGSIVECFPNNPNYETLWREKLFPYLSRASYLESIGSIVLQTRSQGVELYNSVSGQNTGIDGWKVIENRERNILTTLRNDLIKFLCKNKDQYPLWDSDDFCSKCEDSKPKKSNFNLGIVTYKTRKDRYYGPVQNNQQRW